MNLFVKNAEEDSHIKKIYSYVREGRSDLEIAKLFNELSVTTADGEIWTSELVGYIRSAFRLDTEDPLFLKAEKIKAVKKKGGCFKWIVLILLVAVIGFFALVLIDVIKNDTRPEAVELRKSLNELDEAVNDLGEAVKGN